MRLTQLRISRTQSDNGMNLRDAMNDEHGPPYPDVLTGREDHLWMAAFAQGYGEAQGILMATSTNGRTMRIHNLSATTRSENIKRCESIDRRTLRIQVRAQLDAMPYWKPESENWGPDPWHEGLDVHRV